MAFLFIVMRGFYKIINYKICKAIENNGLFSDRKCLPNHLGLSTPEIHNNSHIIWSKHAKYQKNRLSGTLRYKSFQIFCDRRCTRMWIFSQDWIFYLVLRIRKVNWVKSIISCPSTQKPLTGATSYSLGDCSWRGYESWA